MSPLVALSGHPNGVWLSILIPISGIAYYYWMGTEDMAAVYVAAGIMVLASHNMSLIRRYCTSGTR